MTKSILNRTIVDTKVRFIFLDLFCGAGGTTHGVSLAKDRNGFPMSVVVACVNHDELAISSHKSNHPECLHFEEDIRTVALAPIAEAIRKAKLKYPNAEFVLWASLECTNFSNAKGGLPRDADSRTLANHLFRYIDELKPDRIMIENVREFMAWGPLNEKGRPVCRKNGRDYIRWTNKVQSYGYSFDWKILNAADFGAYQSRVRYFAQFARKGQPIKWPEATHAKQGYKDAFGEKKTWKPVRDVLELDKHGRSIFNRERPLSLKTFERIYAGLEKFVPGNTEWLLRYRNNGVGVNKGRNIDEPAPTLTCSVFPRVVFLSTYYGNSQNRSIDQPSPTAVSKDFAGKVSVFVDQQFGQSKPVSDQQPIGALTTNPKYNLVFLDKQYGTGVPQSVNIPCGTLTSNPKIKQVACRLAEAPNHHYLINPQFNNKGASVNAPSPTIIARQDKKPLSIATCETGAPVLSVNYVDAPIIRKVKEFMLLHGIVDIKMRMLTIKELKRIQGFPDDYVLNGPKTAQKKFIGNAVETGQARALIEAYA